MNEVKNEEGGIKKTQRLKKARLMSLDKDKVRQ